MEEFIENVFFQMWPMIVICSIIMVVLRIAYLIKSKTKIVIHHEIFMFIFVLYMMCLFYVVTFQDIDSRGVSGYNITPFREMFRYPIGSRLFYRNVIGNLLMFIPFGFFTSYILRKTKIYWVILITGIISLAIELLQAQIGRVFDIDDVILNIIGGSIGYLCFSVIYHFKRTA